MRESTNWSRHWSTIRPSQGTCWARDGPSTWTQRRQPLPSIQGWTLAISPMSLCSDISPVILAAHLNQFEILQMLLRKDASIEKPHKHYWLIGVVHQPQCAQSFCSSCEACEEERINDGLHRSLKWINKYRALASPAWISLTSSDPILSAFKLSRELQKRAKVEDEFKDQYLQLSGCQTNIS